MQPDGRWKPLCNINQGGQIMKKIVAIALSVVLFFTMTPAAFAFFMWIVVYQKLRISYLQGAEPPRAARAERPDAER